MSRIGCLVLVIVPLGAIAALSLYPRVKRIEKRGPQNLDSVLAIVPVNEDAAAEIVSNMFRDRDRGPQGKWERFRLAITSDPIFPDDDQLRAVGKRDASLARYAAIEPDLRNKDLYLFEPTGDYYWPSEYYWNNAPAKFRCGFIIHFEPAGGSHTKIETFEYVPTIWVGKAFHFLGHHGPDFYYDIRQVKPSTQDRLELLTLLKQRLAAR